MTLIAYRSEQAEYRTAGSKGQRVSNIPDLSRIRFDVFCILFAVNDSTSCNDDLITADGGVPLKFYYALLLLGQALNGFAGTCYYTIGITFLDESVSTKAAPLYLGQLQVRECSLFTHLDYLHVVYIMAIHIAI